MARRERSRRGRPGWQVFLTNPITEPDPAKQQTKVFVPLVPLARGEASP